MHHRMTKAWGGGLLAAALLAIVSVLALAPSATRVHASDERLTSTVAQSAFTDDCNDDAKKNTQECKD